MSRIIEARGLQADYIVEGEHVYNPPVGEVLMSDPRAAYFERPMGFYSEALRSGIIGGSARMGGVGGGGLTLAVMLAKEGVRDFSVADIDNVDATNVGRIPMLTPAHIGRHKADVAAELITAHNPTARVRVYKNGITEDNVAEFMGHDAGNEGITVGFDGIELTEPVVALWLHRAARLHGRHVIASTDVDRGGMVTTFRPDNLRHSFEHYMGAKPLDSEDEYLRKVKGFQLPTIPNVPKTGTLQTLLATQKDVPLPTTLRSVLNATDLALDEFERLVALNLGEKGHKDPHFYPRIHCVNPSQSEDFVSRYPRLRSTARLGLAMLRDVTGLNPPASYSDEDRVARATYRAQVAAGFTE